MGCSGILLTGGASTRMGRDKATLVIGGQTLAARTALLLVAVCDPCVEVGPGVSGLEAVREDPAGGGPLVALAAGAAAVGTSAPALVLACDLPRLTPKALRWLVEHPSPRSVVPIWEGRPQPLCARWSAEALAAADRLVRIGARAMRALLEDVDPELVEVPAELRGALEDVDTPDQLAGLPGVDSP